MRRILVPLLLLALLPSPAASESHFMVRVGAHGETVEELCDRLGLELLGGVDPSGHTFLVAASDYLDTESVLDLLLSEPQIKRAELVRSLDLPEVNEGEANDVAAALVKRFSELASQDLFSDSPPVKYFGSPVAPAYVIQPAASLLKIHEAHQDFGAGAGKVAVIDTGVDPNHPALKRSLVSGYDFVHEKSGAASEWSDLDQSTVAVLDQSTVAVLDQSTVAVLNQSTVAVLNDPRYSAFGHGTMVAGLIHLVAPNAKIMPLKVFRSDGRASSADIVRAVYHAVEHEADVINMSFSFDDFSPEIMRAVNYATRHGVICVSSVGNQGKEILVYPASFANILGVGATTLTDERSEISNFGEDVVSLAAPGEEVISTYPGGRYAAGFGTSFSAALVAGAAALLLDVDGETDQYLAAKALSHARRLSEEMGYGRLDAYEALSALQAELIRGKDRDE
ncbi:MAG: S8 family serine peptidase [Acidobacteriota bacterium]